MSHNTVYSIVQDDKGFIWLGTREGLNKYDSYKIKNYYVKGSKLGGSANKINSLLNIRNDIYVGTDNGLYLYDSRKDDLYAYPGFEKFAILFLNLHKNNIYVGTSNGLYIIKSGKSRLITKRDAAKSICNLAGGRLLLNIGNQLQIIDEEGKIQRQFSSSAFSYLTEPDFSIFSIYKDRENRIWICSNKGLFSYNQDDDRFSRIQFCTSENNEINTVRSVTRNKENKLFIGTENGLYVYNLGTGVSENYQQSFNYDAKKLNDKAIYSTYTANDGSIWLGTYFGGANFIPPANFGFKSFLPNDRGDGLSGKAISQMMEDKERRLWIGTEDGGISVYDPKTNSFSYINKDSRPYYLNINNVHAIHDDGYGNVWVGTFLGGVHRFNTKTKKTTIYINQPDNPNSLSNNQVYGIYRDSRGMLWVATQSGLNTFDYQRNSFRLFKAAILGKMFIYDLTEDKNGDMWFCTRQNGVYRYLIKDDTLIHYTTPKLSSNQVISVYKDTEHRLWFGTLDGGVSMYDTDTDRFTRFTIKDGLPNNNVYGALEDQNKDMWFSTNRGLSKYDVRSHKFTNYDNRLGLPSNQFNFKSFLKSSDKTLYFGSINGLSYFSPQQIASKNLYLPLRFTDFLLFNNSVKVGGNSVLKQQIDDTESINLSYSQNVFTIDYAALNYANPGSDRFAYYLEGFEKGWNYAGYKNAVTYTNLSPGTYTFHIKAVDADGTRLSDERTLIINVSPPFYLTRLAYLFYFILLCLLIWVYSYFIKFLHQKKLEIQLERIEKEKIKELTQHRLNFFTFISHEFKTPLTLILASIDQFLERKEERLKKNAELSIIKNNASRLFKLIQQLMEFTKMENDHYSSRISRNDILELIRCTLFSFKTLTDEKGISLIFNTNQDQFNCYFDSDKVEKVLMNIISNAVKNTFEGEISIDVNIRTDNSENTAKVIIEIKDTGIGMSSEDLKNAFIPFYRARQSKGKGIEGSGIGLSLVNSLINYLKGEVSIESRLNKGTLVKVSIPVLTLLTSENSEVSSKISEVETPANGPDKGIHNAEQDKVGLSKYKILIVEDNKELLNFLSKHFSKSHEVITALNGASAFNKIVKNAPDVIISDIKMPKMDGIELCNKVKSDARFNFIPFILLSSDATETSRVAGLHRGADAYLNKPFNLKEFDLLVTNMIKSRVQLREHVIGIGKFTLNHLPRNNKDQEFLSKLSDVLEKRFSDPKLTVDDIANDLSVSRTSLHLSLKKLMDKSATELLNEYRLKKAVLMLENDLPIGEIAYYCGYSDPNYFSRIFRKHYQCSPLQYKEKVTGNL